MDYPQIIEQVIKAVGTEKNIISYRNCMTRLRITVKDGNAYDGEALNNIEGILGVKENGDELQLIFGPGKVDKARQAMDDYYKENGLEVNSSDLNDDFEATIKAQKDGVKSKRTTKFQAFMGKFSNIFVPLIPGFIAAGILAGFAGLFTQLGYTNDFITYINVFNASLMKFMYIMIGFNAMSAFGGSGVLGGILAGLYILTYGPDAPTSGMDTFLGFAIDPRGGIIGILFTTILGAKLEQLIRRNFSWESTDIITTPMLTLLIMGAFTFLVIMPISAVLFSGMSWAFAHLNSNPLGAGILAGLFLPAVMMGIHQGFVPVYEGLVQTVGFNTLFPILAMAGAGQVGTSIALYVKAPKDSKLRKNIRGAIIPGFLGIGEPLIYGVTLPRVRPFFTAMAGGAVGGLYIGTLAQMGYTFGLNTVFGSSGLIGVFAQTSNNGVVEGMVLYLSALCVSYVAGFVITYYFGTKNVDLS